MSNFLPHIGDLQDATCVESSGILLLFSGVGFHSSGRKTIGKSFCRIKSWDGGEALGIKTCCMNNIIGPKYSPKPVIPRLGARTYNSSSSQLEVSSDKHGPLAAVGVVGIILQVLSKGLRSGP